MTVSMEKKLGNYYKQIEKALECPAELKDKILQSLKSDIEDYCDLHQDADFSMIVEHFGEPELFAQEYVATLDKGTVCQEISKTKIIKRAAIAAIAGLLLIGTIFGIIIAVKNAQKAGVYYSEDVSVVTQ